MAVETPLLDTVNYPADLRKLEKSQLRQLADELRAEMIDAVSVTGGHLGSGLGVVELTTAIHYVFNTPDDRLVWDVGHQCYPHKILTGAATVFARCVRAAVSPGSPSGRKANTTPSARPTRRRLSLRRQVLRKPPAISARTQRPSPSSATAPCPAAWLMRVSITPAILGQNLLSF